MANITLSTTGIEALPQGNLRKSFVMQNLDATINIHLRKTRPGEAVATTTNSDVRLSPGGNFSMNTQEDGEEAVHERWTAVASSGTPVLVVFESKDRKYL